MATLVGVTLSAISGGVSSALADADECVPCGTQCHVCARSYVLNNTVFMGLLGRGQAVVLAALYTATRDMTALAFGVSVSRTWCCNVAQRLGAGSLYAASEACDPTVGHTTWNRVVFLASELQREVCHAK